MREGEQPDFARTQGMFRSEFQFMARLPREQTAIYQCQLLGYLAVITPTYGQKWVISESGRTNFIGLNKEFHAICARVARSRVLPRQMKREVEVAETSARHRCIKVSEKGGISHAPPCGGSFCSPDLAVSLFMRSHTLYLGCIAISLEARSTW